MNHPRTHGIAAAAPRLLAVLASLLLVFVPLAAAANGVLRLGVINERPEKPDFALEQLGMLHEYLRAALAADGVEVGPLVITQSLDEMVQRLRAGEVDAVFEGVMPTLYLDDATGTLEPRMLAWRKGQRSYHSVFFVRNDSPVRSLGDLAGRRIVFESHRSTSAFFIPMAALDEAGVMAVPGGSPGAPEAARYDFAGSETNQGYWVMKGRADAGAFNDGDWERLPENLRAELRIIYRTRPVLRWLVSFHRDTDPALRAAAESVLTRMHDDEAGAAALHQAERITRIELLDDEDRANLEAWRPVFRAVKPLL